MPQLDIFADSRDRLPVNPRADAMTRGHAAQARSAGAALQAAFPKDRHLEPATWLIDALAPESPVASAPTALPALQALLRPERQGRHRKTVTPRRQLQLQALHPAPFAPGMATR